MRSHVKALGVLYLVLGVLGVLVAILAVIVLGGAAGIVSTAADPQDAAVAVPILGIVGSMVALVLLVLSAPSIIVGYGLLKARPWARIGGIVLSILNLAGFPVGTIIGIYGLWVLLAANTKMLFDTPPAPDV
ncbi:MAG: hypothetical protein HY329_02220 [Chloroflexi bacterium]|nr:hypothetical protein [Chloroflexota bacterium]